MDLTSEQQRISRHLWRAEMRARAAVPPDGGGLVRLVRALLLDELARYRRGARFPRSPDPVAPRPTFIDADGTRCAVAALLEAGGESELVARIARERNHAYVAELADEPRLRAWLAAAGLRVAEAAAIQPEYCRAPAECVCQFPGASLAARPAIGVLDAVVVQQTNPQQPPLAQVRAIHGDGRGFQIGDAIRINLPVATPIGTRFLVRLGDSNHALDAGIAELSGLELDQGTWSGCGPAIAADEVVQIALAPDCQAKIASSAPALLRETCDGQMGCSVSPGAPTTIGILMALLALRAARRR